MPKFIVGKITLNYEKLLNLKEGLEQKIGEKVIQYL
jgi:hypothetical protein